MGTLRESILAADDMKRVAIATPEWGVTGLFVRTLSGRERDSFEASCLAIKGKKREANLDNIRAKLVCLATCDKDGNAVFAPSDVDALGQKSSAVLDRLFAEAQRLNGITEEDVEELAKN